MLRKPTWQETVVGPSELQTWWVAFGWQPPRKRGSFSYSHIAMNSVNSLREVGSGRFLGQTSNAFAAFLTPGLPHGKVLGQRTQLSCAWPAVVQKLWDDPWLLFSATKDVAVCCTAQTPYTATKSIFFPQARADVAMVACVTLFRMPTFSIGNKEGSSHFVLSAKTSADYGCSTKTENTHRLERNSKIYKKSHFIQYSPINHWWLFTNHETLGLHK